MSAEQREFIESNSDMNVEELAELSSEFAKIICWINGMIAEKCEKISAVNSRPIETSRFRHFNLN